MISLVLVLALAPAADPAADDPIAPAAHGKVQCYAPNMERKTCASIGAYTRRSDGTVDNRAIVLVAPTPLVVMDTTTPTTIKAGAICGPIRASDIDAATITVDGK